MTYEELQEHTITQLEYFNGFIFSRYMVIALVITFIFWLGFKFIIKMEAPNATDDELQRVERLNLILLAIALIVTVYALYSIFYIINTKNEWKEEYLSQYIDGLDEHIVTNAEIIQIDLASKTVNEGIVYWTDEDVVNKELVDIIYSNETNEPYLTYKTMEGDVIYRQRGEPLYFKDDKVGYKLYLPKNYDFEKVHFVR